MIPLNLLPSALRTAPVEEQLLYLLQRRRTIIQLMRSLETYAKESDGALRAGQGPADGVAA